jgi:hypothetical protein
MPLLRAAIVSASALSIVSITLGCWAGAVLCAGSSVVGNALSGIGGIRNDVGVTWLGVASCGTSCSGTMMGTAHTGYKDMYW